MVSRYKLKSVENSRRKITNRQNFLDFAIGKNYQ